MRLRKKSFQASYADAVPIWGINGAFRGMLPPVVIVNETETRDNELRGAEAGIWCGGRSLSRCSRCNIGTLAHLTAKYRKSQEIDPTRI
jgi:hypothetical protein